METVRVPPLRDDDPQGTVHDDDQPLVLTTISDDADLTLVLGIEGRVNAAGATRLELRFPDGASREVDVAPDGTYKIILGESQQDAFAARPGSLVALDERGRVIATALFASVSYGRSHPG